MVELLTVAEKVEIVKIVGDRVRSSREAAAEFNRRHPDRQNIYHGTVAAITRLFNETGSVVKPRQRQLENVNRYPADHAILAAYQANPHISLRNLALNLNISRCKIWRGLKRHKLTAFKPKFLHTLEHGDLQKRLEYCFWCQGNFLNDRDFLSKIMFTDEATFTTNGVVSSQNCRYWAVENPNWIINCKRQYSKKVNVWCGIFNSRIIGPFFFNNTLNSERFLHFLNNEFWDAIEDLPLDLRCDLYFQQDGASVHNVRIIREWLNEHMPLRWIGRNSPLIEWPPRSPDLTPLDFYFWGHIKNKVYKHRPQTREELCDRIREACAEVTPQELRRVEINNRRRIEKCIRIHGDLVERGSI